MAPSVRSFTRNADIADRETLDDNMLSLAIDQGDYFNFQVDDADARQAAVNFMDGAMAEAANGLRDEADRYVAGLFVDIDPANVVDGADLDADTAYEALVDLGAKLDESNTPSGGRFAIIPPWRTVRRWTW